MGSLAGSAPALRSLTLPGSQGCPEVGFTFPSSSPKAPRDTPKHKAKRQGLSCPGAATALGAPQRLTDLWSALCPEVKTCLSHPPFCAAVPTLGRANEGEHQLLTSRSAVDTGCSRSGQQPLWAGLCPPLGPPEHWLSGEWAHRAPTYRPQ